MTGSATFQFPPDVTAPAAARRFVASVLTGWGCESVVEVSELLVSELVTNSVRHARTGGLLTVHREDGLVRVEATDGGDGMPSVRRPTPDEPSGRGLAIVAKVADRWGIETNGDHGHTVWFELDVS